MKNNIKYIVVCTLMLFGIYSCETDFDNPNAATEEQTFSTREGVFAAAIGLKQLYSTTGLRWLIETPAITTREGGITTTFQNMIELEDGGQDLPNFNSNVQGLWSSMLRVMKIAEDLDASIAGVELENGTRSGLTAYAKLFKAMAIGALAQNYEQVIIQSSNNNDAEFVNRNDGFLEAIRLLNEAQDAIEESDVSDEFTENITQSNIDLQNTISAIIARYSLFSGNYEQAISAANSVDQGSTSIFAYDGQNQNPIWARVIQNDAPNFKPRDNFGLPTDEFSYDEDDGRLDFYLIPLDETNLNGLPIENLSGFFNEITEFIPVYLPDEMNLIIAEANLRKSSPDVDEAINALNEVLTDTNDPFDVNAGLEEYSGEESVDALLDEIYKNRRAELFLTGMSLEDSRRFDRPEPSGQEMQYDEERNRNFYPFPDLERNSNPNTPADPSI